MVLRSITWKWDLDPNFGPICSSLTLLSTEMKFEYQPEEKEIDVVEELELYSLMMSRTQGEGGRGPGLGVRTLVFFVITFNYTIVALNSSRTYKILKLNLV